MARPFSGPAKPCPLCDLPVATRGNGTVKMHIIPPGRLPPSFPIYSTAWCEGGNPLRSGHLTYPAKPAEDDPAITTEETP
jgi:hypothetical protein